MGGSLTGRMQLDSNLVGVIGGLAGEQSGGGGGSVEGRSSGSGSNSVPTAYWDSKRSQRRFSSLVFPTKAPDNTEEILQPDPDLSGTVRVIFIFFHTKYYYDNTAGWF